MAAAFPVDMLRGGPSSPTLAGYSDGSLVGDYHGVERESAAGWLPKVRERRCGVVKAKYIGVSECVRIEPK